VNFFFFKFSRALLSFELHFTLNMSLQFLNPRRHCKWRERQPENRENIN
jgi:hypothetical protein